MTDSQRSADSLTLVTRLLAGAVAVLGAIVMAAWVAHWPGALRLHPSLPVMMFNTALLFGVSAAALFAGASRHVRMERACGVVVLSIAVPTGLQFALGRSFGVDTLFLEPFMATAGWPAGRMAPVTAAAFTLLGIVWVARGNTRPASAVRALAASALLALSGFALVERSFGDTRVSSAGTFVGMAAHTAVGLQACAVSLLCLAWRDDRRRGGLPVWLPHGLIVSVVVFTALLGATLATAFPREATPLVLAVAATLGLVLAALTGLSTRLMMLARDRATESERAAAALVDSEQRRKLALDSAGHGLWDWYVRSGHVELDDNWWALLGYQPNELPARVESWSDGIHPDDKDLVLEALRRSLQADAWPYDVEYRAHCKDGTWRWINTRGRVASRDAEGNAIRMIGTIHDISDRKGVEHAMAEQAKSYGVIVDAASDIIYRADLEGRFTFANAAAADLLGTPMSEVLGQHYLTLVRPDARAAARAFYERQVREQLTNSYYEFPVVTRQNTEVWLGQNVRLLTENGRITGVLGVARNITERRQLDRELREAHDLAVDSTRLKSEFLANMSHEIRTPMNGVIGLAELLIDTPLTDEQRHHVEGIRASGESLLTVINDILDFSKIEAGMLAVEAIDFDLRATLDRTVQPFLEPVRRKRIAICLPMADDVPSAVRGDPVRLRQILTNLVGNAVKFTEAGEISVRMSKEMETESEVVIRFEVRDTGIGIAPEAVGRLFRAFVQADGSTARQFGGTGLGLVISKRLVELMGGAMGVESTLGVGSTFWFTLALAKGEPLAPSDDAHVDLGGRRALVVDDNATNRLVLSGYLKGRGLEVVEAEDAAHAVGLMRAAIAERRPFDVALLDQMMPGVDGVALARALKADPSVRAARLILLPSDGRRGDGRRARESGVDAYLPKPVRYAELMACLSTLFADDASGPRPGTDGTLLTRHTLVNSSTNSDHPLILVAEDNPLNQDVTRGQLERLGYRVDIVSNGLEAVRALECRPYAAVLMDCQMPGMDGVTATAAIRRREGTTRHTPIIALTAHALHGERERCLQSGMDDYLAKPVKRHDLAHALERWTGHWSHEHGVAVDSKVNLRHDEATPAAIDISRLEGVRQEIGSEHLASSVDTILSDVAKMVERLRQGLHGSSEELEFDAHRLTGGCRTLGFDAMGATCEQIETLGIEIDSATSAARLDSERKAVLAWWQETEKSASAVG